jgi:UDP-glucose/GDP-mannose dehydrogenase family, NAD binding domain
VSLNNIWITRSRLSMGVLTPSTEFQDDTWDSIRKLNGEVSIEEVTSTPSSSGSSPRLESFPGSASSLSVDASNDYLSDVQDDEIPLVAVLGIGYVGLHLVTAFAKHYNVIAFDISEKRLAKVEGLLSDTANIYFTSHNSDLASATHFLVAVPTPLVSGATEIDTTMIRSALETIQSHARRGATVVIESSVSVGMTRSLLGKIAQEHGLQAGMSPEVRSRKLL